MEFNSIRRNRMMLIGLALVAGLGCRSLPDKAPQVTAPEAMMTDDVVDFAIIGDYGAVLQRDSPDQNELRVARLVNEHFCPEFVITVGDNNYNELTENTFRRSVGNYYSDYGPEDDGTLYSPRRCNSELDGTRFYPAPGNCGVVGACTETDGGDYTNLDAYSDYFQWARNDSALHPCDSVATEIQEDYPNFSCPEPGTYEDLFYDFVRGSVHFFSLNTYCPDAHEDGGCYNVKIPEGREQTNRILGDPSANPCAQQYLTQMIWVQHLAKGSNAPWKIAYFHHPPYSSGSHDSCAGLQFDYQAMGVSIVLAGHNHSYNRVSFDQDNARQDEYVFITLGLGGASASSDSCAFPVSGNPTENILYAENHGAMKARASEDQLILGFYEYRDASEPVDEVVLTRQDETVLTTYCPDGCDRTGILNCLEAPGTDPGAAGGD